MLFFQFARNKHLPKKMLWQCCGKQKASKKAKQKNTLLKVAQFFLNYFCIKKKKVFGFKKAKSNHIYFCIFSSDLKKKKIL